MNVKFCGKTVLCKALAKVYLPVFLLMLDGHSHAILTNQLCAQVGELFRNLDVKFKRPHHSNHPQN